MTDECREAVTLPHWHRIRIDREHTIASILYEPAICSCGEQWDEASYAIGHAYSANAILEDEMLAALGKIRDALLSSPLVAISGIGQMKDAIAEALIEVGIDPHGI